MMLKKTLNEFTKDADTLVKGAIVNDDFVTITTDVGNAVVISEAEWQILVEGMRHLLTSI